MKKKVLIIVGSLRFSGGAPKVAASFTTSLSDKYDFSILTLYHFDNLVPFKGKYYSLKESQHFSRIFIRLFKLYKVVKAVSPDIIITFMSHTSYWIIPIMYLFKINTPLIISVNTNPDKQYKKRIYFKYLIRFFYPLTKVSAIVPVSKELREILTKKYKIPKNKILPIYNGINIEKIQNKAKENVDDFEEIFNDTDRMKFITIGRLSGEKGHKYLIEAYSEVIKEIPNSKLFIIGEGQLRGQLEEMIRIKGLESHIILLGLKENPYKYISKANIFVFPSLHEGLPYVLLEALACKIPIISTDCRTGPKEILENGKYGILVNTADSDDLAEKMIQLAKDKNAREVFSEKSMERVKIFDVSNFVNNWLKLLNHYLKKD